LKEGIKMANCKLAIEIDAPIEVVWDLTQDPKRRAEWDFRIKEAELLDATSPRKGAKFRSRGSLIGGFELKMEYVTVELYRRSAVKLLESKGVPFKSGGGSWHYRSLDTGKTCFETNIRMMTGTSMFDKFVDYWFAGPFLKWMTLKSLKKLKIVAEADVLKKGGGMHV
jgi:hypothetical protein